MPVRRKMWRQAERGRLAAGGWHLIMRSASVLVLEEGNLLTFHTIHYDRLITSQVVGL
jgi:hypothetical protein